MTTVYHLITKINLQPTDEFSTYGAETYEIESGCAGEPPFTGNWNNVAYDWDGVEYETYDDAEAALQELAGDDYGVRAMGAAETSDWLYEAVATSVTATTTDREIEALLDEWDADARDGSSSGGPSTIDYDTARSMCEERRAELVDAE